MVLEKVGVFVFGWVLFFLRFFFLEKVFFHLAKNVCPELNAFQRTTFSGTVDASGMRTKARKAVGQPHYFLARRVFPKLRRAAARPRDCRGALRIRPGRRDCFQSGWYPVATSPFLRVAVSFSGCFVAEGLGLGLP